MTDNQRMHIINKIVNDWIYSIKSDKDALDLILAVIEADEKLQPPASLIGKSERETDFIQRPNGADGGVRWTGGIL